MRDERVIGCEHCWPGNPDAAWTSRSSLRQIELIDNSHFGAILCRCEGCGQHFVSIFSEQVDWVDGEDPQYWTVLPILDSEVADLEGQAEAELVAYLVAVGSERRALHRDYPKGGEPRSFWRDGLRVI